MLIQTTSIVDCRGMQLTMLRPTVQKDIIWFRMTAHMCCYHILGIRILIIIMHSNFDSLAQGQQVQVQGSQAQTQGQPRQQVTGMDADEFINRITAMM